MESLNNTSENYITNLKFESDDSDDDGGYDKERIISNTELYEELLCPICHKIIKDPRSCSICECHFCNSCINKWLVTSNSNKCPNGCDCMIKRAAPILMSLISKLKVKCKFTKFGCDKILSYDGIHKHEDQCGFKKIKCEHCFIRLLKSDLTQHYENCPQNPVLCEVCQMKIKRKDKENHSNIACLTETVKNLQKTMISHFQILENKMEKIEKKVGKLTRDIKHIQKKDEASDLNNSLIKVVSDVDSQRSLSCQIEVINQGLICDEFLGIKTNLSLKTLVVDNDWKIIYYKGYDHYTNNLELNNIKSQYFTNNSQYSNTLICVGAIDESADPDNILICGLDFISNALEETNSINKANEGSNNIFWYWVTYKSFGFSPNSIIFLSCADSTDVGKCDKRISWCVHGTCGGSRIGIRSGETQNHFKKVILVKTF